MKKLNAQKKHIVVMNTLDTFRPSGKRYILVYPVPRIYSTLAKASGEGYDCGVGDIKLEGEFSEMTIINPKSKYYGQTINFPAHFDTLEEAYDFMQNYCIDESMGGTAYYIASLTCRVSPMGDKYEFDPYNNTWKYIDEFYELLKAELK